MRAEFQAIATGLDKMPTITGNGNRVIHINAGGTALTNTAGFTFDGTTLTVPAITSSGAVTLTGAVSVLDSQFSIKDNADTTKVAQFQASGITTGTTRTYTLPNASDTIAVLDTAQTLTNKTFDASVAKGVWTASGTWTIPAVTLGGTLSWNGHVASGTLTNGGTITTIDINGGTIDGVTIGGAAAGAGTFTTITASGTVTLSGTGPHAIGGATNANRQVHIAGAFAGSSSVVGLGVQSSLTIPTNGNGFGLLVDASITEAGSGTHPILAGASIEATFINAAAMATAAYQLRVVSFVAPTGTTTAATIYANNATSGATTNYALFIDDGVSRFDGNIEFSSTVGANGTIRATDTGFLAFNGGSTGTRFYSNSGATEFVRIIDAGYFKASNSGSYFSSTSSAHEFSRDADDSTTVALIVRNAAATVTNQFGMQIRLTGDPNDATRYFGQLIGNVTERMTWRSNGGLANFQANDVNLSDARAKPDFERYTPEFLRSASLALEQVDWGRFKYADQTHDDWNHGPTAQGVRKAFSLIAPELVDEWQPGKSDLLAVYETDLTHIAIAAHTYRISDHESRLAALEARL